GALHEVPAEEREPRRPRHPPLAHVGAGCDPDRHRRDNRAGPRGPDRRHRGVRPRLAPHGAESMWLRRRNLAVVAELLLPPLGLAALELGLRLRDVRGELRLLLAEPL